MRLFNPRSIEALESVTPEVIAEICGVHGWRLVEGQLVAPHGVEWFGTGDVMSIRFLRQLIASYQTDQLGKAGRLDQRTMGSCQAGGEYRLIGSAIRL